MLLCELCVCLVLWRIGTIAAELINDNNGNSFIQLDNTGISENVDNNLDYQDDENIAGIPNADYPTYRIIPRTSFSCRGRNRWGYYADVEAGCQVFHICQNQYSKVSFLCPIGSVFNQRHLICDWWYNFDCEPEIQLLEEESRPNGYTPGPLISAVEDPSVVGASSDLSVTVLSSTSVSGRRKERHPGVSGQRANQRGQQLLQQPKPQSQPEVVSTITTANPNIDKQRIAESPSPPQKVQRRNSKRINIYKIATPVSTSNETARNIHGNKSSVGR